MKLLQPGLSASKPPVLHNDRIRTIAIDAYLGGRIRTGSINADRKSRADISAFTTVPRIDARVRAGLIAEDQARHATAISPGADHSQ